MSTEIWITGLSILPPTIAALAALIVSLRTDRKASEIHVLVNSNLTALKAELAWVKEELAKMHRLHPSGEA